MLFVWVRGLLGCCWAHAFVVVLSGCFQVPQNSDPLQATGSFKTLIAVCAGLDLQCHYEGEFFKILETNRPIHEVKPSQVLAASLASQVQIWDPHKMPRKPRAKSDPGVPPDAPEGAEPQDAPVAVLPMPVCDQWDQLAAAEEVGIDDDTLNPLVEEAERDGVVDSAWEDDLDNKLMELLSERVDLHERVAAALEPEEEEQVEQPPATIDQAGAKNIKMPQSLPCMYALGDFVSSP